MITTIKKTIKKAAQAVILIALVLSLIAIWRHLTGLIAEERELGHIAAESGNIVEWVGVVGLYSLMEIGLVLIMGGIGIGVLATYEAMMCTSIFAGAKIGPAEPQIIHRR